MPASVFHSSFPLLDDPATKPSAKELELKDISSINLLLTILSRFAFLESLIHAWRVALINIKMEAPTGFEPVMRELQSLALPLGYGAINLLDKH